MYINEVEDENGDGKTRSEVEGYRREIFGDEGVDGCSEAYFCKCDDITSNSVHACVRVECKE